MGREYFIDFNRGSDSNDGLTAPWKNVSKLAGFTLTDGDCVLFANDSVWDMTSTVVQGTLSGRVTYSNYDPGGAPTSRPTLTVRRTLVAGDWTYDAPNNAWYYDIGYDPGWGSFVLLGGDWGVRQESALPLATADKRWINSGTKFYVYAPSGTNPTAYYGSVVVGPHFRGALTFSDDGSEVIVENLRGADGGALVSVYSSTSTRNYTLRNLESYNSAVAVFLNSQTAGTLSVLVDGLHSDLGISAFLHAQETGGLGFGDFTVRNCVLSRGNRGYPQGAIYSQVRKRHVIEHNRIRDIAYGTAAHANDGCAIYTEVGCDQALVRWNRIEDCHLALQDNSGRRASFFGNVIRNCFAAIRLSDFSNVGSVDHEFDHNTIINGGTAVAAQGPNSVAGHGWYADDTSLAVKIRNNIFQGSSAQPAIELGSGTTGTIANNAWHGYGTFALRYDGAASPITATGTLNVNPQIDANFRPQNPDLVGAGTPLAGIDFYGRPYESTPTIGAVEYADPRAYARSRHERKAAVVVEIDLDRCENTYGTAPCTASGGTKCYNTFSTCQDTANFTRGTHTYRFCNRGMPLPPGELVRPYIDRADGAVTVIDPEAGLARRGTLKLGMVDETDSDLEQDPYTSTRASAAQGSFWSRLIARNPNMAGRPVRVRRGYVVEPWDWNTFLDERYIIEKVDGPDRDGVDITLKDPIKLVDRTKVPVATDGKITAALADYAHRGLVQGATSTTVVLEGEASSTDDAYNGMEVYIVSSQGAGQRRTITDYVGETRTATVAAWAVTPGTSSTYEVSALSLTVTAGKGAQYADPATSGKREFVRLGEEVIEYTALTSDTLSWPSSDSRAQFGTTRKAHNVDTGVQQCRAFIDEPVTDVLQAILTEGGLDAANLDTDSFTDAEPEWYGPAYYVTAVISEPEQPSDLLAELLPQVGAVIWWNLQTQKAVFKPIVPALGTPVEWTDAAHLVEDSVSVDALEDLRLTRAAIYYAQANATSNRREAKNFALGEIYIDTSAESENEYGDRRDKVTYSRWFGEANGIAMRTWVSRQLTALRAAPRRLKLRLDPKDYATLAGELVDITTRRLADTTGAAKTTRCLVTKVDDRGTHIEVEARTTGFDRNYGFIAPDGTADHPTDTVYAHVTENTGLMGDGSDGTLII